MGNQTNLSAIKTAPRIGPALCFGFLTAVLMWCVWFITHLPGLRLPSAPTAIALLATLWAGMTACGIAVGRERAPTVGAGAGLICSLLNLLILGAFLAEPAGEESLRPAAPLMAGGFLLLGGIVGLAAAWSGAKLTRSVQRQGTTWTQRVAEIEARFPEFWLGRLALVAVIALAPLLLIGGGVTSTGSGLAVPDWPGTYGTSMFLYPIGLMAHPMIFLEHSHRLFGTLVGLTMIALAVYAMALFRRQAAESLLVGLGLLVPIVGAMFIRPEGAEGPVAGILIPLSVVAMVVTAGWIWHAMRGRRPAAFATGLLVLVVIQGVLGGVRVTEASPYYGVFHGVVAQIILALTVALAAHLSLTYRGLPAIAPAPADRRRKFFATGLVHALILQLVLGATFRHLSTAEPPVAGAMHAMWLHVLFALVVVVFACAAGFSLSARGGTEAQNRTLRTTGWWIIGSVGFQFAIGWVALLVVLGDGGRGTPPTAEQLHEVDPVPLFTVLVTTAHQANGALLLALASLALVWSRRLVRGRGEAAEGSGR
jgi:heme A synthase